MKLLSYSSEDLVQILKRNKKRGNITYGWTTISLLKKGHREGDLLIVQDNSGKWHGVDPVRAKEIVGWYMNLRFVSNHVAVTLSEMKLFIKNRKEDTERRGEILTTLNRLIKRHGRNYYVPRYDKEIPKESWSDFAGFGWLLSAYENEVE